MLEPSSPRPSGSSDPSPNPESGPGDFEKCLGRALSGWNERGRVADLLGPLFEWLLFALEAERAMLFTVNPGEGLKARASRSTDGETIRDAERWVSPHVVRRARESDEPTFFEDTLRDRRFRTEPEQELSVRIRSVLTMPIKGGDVEGLLYFDSRFKTLQWPLPGEDRLEILGDLMAAALRHEEVQRVRRDLERRVTRLEREPVVEVTTPEPAPAIRTGLREVDFHGFRTCSPELLQSLTEVERLANSMISIVIEGESGTGKEVLARALHEASGRPGPVVSLHCGAVPRSLIEIELFGHAKGAFTGAEKDRAGLFDLARGGTIFLDDIGEMSSEMQVALLRVLETGRFRPVSAEEERSSDVRVISASLVPTGDAEGSIASIRPDLFYRLAGAKIRVPPLRERREDILPLTLLFLERHSGEHLLPLTSEMESALISYDWPGNVRELENVIRQFIALGETEMTRARFEDITETRTIPSGMPVGNDGAGDMQTILNRAEREAIIRTLVRASGNKSLASKMLGLSRKTLYRRMEKHGIPL